MSVFRCCPVVVFHSRTVLSQLALAIVFPSGEKRTLLTKSACPMSVLMCCPVVVFHNRTVSSQLALAIVLPSSEKRTLLTVSMPYECFQVLSCGRVPQPHGFVQLALAIVLPSGEKHTLLTMSVCPVSVFRCCPVVASHNRTVLSQLALAIVFPSGEKHTLLTLTYAR